MEIKNPEFDDIRPCYDDEVPAIINRLVENPEFKRALQFILPDADWEKLKAFLLTFQNKYDFQQDFIKKEVYKFVGKMSASIDCSGFENIEHEGAYTYISNHRDIVLDASLLSSMLGYNGYDTTEIAIGDNLLAQPWIKDLVRLNKSFIVKRDVSIRQVLEVSQHLSKYIHFAIKEKKESVWIAQREGRAKDSNDRTQESLLKMLAMGGEKSFLENMEELNITPVTFSYEYDPCDYLKAKEFQQKRDNPDFKKSQRDDLINMETGLFDYKGNIHFQIGSPINSQLKGWDKTLAKNILVPKLAALIDKEIFLNYRFYPGNYIAYDRLWGGNSFDESYTNEDIQVFEAYLQKQLQKIDLPDKDLPYLEEKILEMYANPLKNQLSVKE
jgi:hypothetical protein